MGRCGTGRCGEHDRYFPNSGSENAYHVPLIPKVAHSSQVTFEEWIHGEPSLAVYWSVPTRTNWKDRWGKSISLLLSEAENSWLLRLWGARWRDDWVSRERQVITVLESTFSLEKLDPIDGLLIPESVVKAVESAILAVEMASTISDCVVVALGGPAQAQETKNTGSREAPRERAKHAIRDDKGRTNPETPRNASGTADG